MSTCLPFCYRLYNILYVTCCEFFNKKKFPFDFSFVIRKTEVEVFSVKKNIHGCNNCNGKE